MVAEVVPCGPDLERHVELIHEYDQAGVDELYVQQIGPDNQEFLRAYERELLPRFNG